MQSEFRAEKTSGQLGIEAVDRAVALAEEHCQFERQYIEYRNLAHIGALQAEMLIHADEVVDLEARIRAAGRPCDERIRRRKLAYYWAIASILVVASFFFSLIAFEPFRLAWKGWLYCVGIAVVTPFCVEKFLEVWDSRRLLKVSVTIGFVAALSSLVLLAVIRGAVLAEHVKAEDSPAVEIESDNPTPAEPQNTFYRDSIALLRLTMALLAVSMELGAGIALHEARLLGPGTGEDPEALRERLRETKQAMARLRHDSDELSNEASVYAARFWSSFYRAMLTHTMRKAVTGLFMVLLLIPVVCHAQASPIEQLNLVVEIDLSSSVAAQGHDGKTEFEKNLSSITNLLSRMPANSRVTVLGITENSFSQPYILLSAKTANDSGYFGEKLAAARREIVRVWRDRAAHLAPTAPGTDILGSLVVAGQLLQQAPDAQRRVLVLFSDMREFTRHLNFETASDIPMDAALAKVDEGRFLANFKGVEVYVIGVDAVGQEVAEWDRVREFWTEYFRKTGGVLRTYSILRPLPEL